MAVVGAVGSGKSSLISSILGEMFKVSGDIRFKVCHLTCLNLMLYLLSIIRTGI